MEATISVAIINRYLKSDFVNIVWTYRSAPTAISKANTPGIKRNNNNNIDILLDRADHQKRKKEVREERKRKGKSSRNTLSIVARMKKKWNITVSLHEHDILIKVRLHYQANK